MPPVAIALVLCSALLHAAWNFLNKDSRDRWAFFFAQGLVSVVLYAPVCAWMWPAQPIAAIGWLWIVATAVTHAGYAFYLLKSYDVGDLSVAYPLSRTAPLLVAAWDMVTMRAELTALGLVGVGLAGIGAVTLQWPALRARGGRAVLSDKVTVYALITAGFIAVFTIIDKQGVRVVHPFIYLYLLSAGEFWLIGAQLGPTAVERLRRELRANARGVLFTAVVGPFSYLLILWVLQTAPASYVLALRQTSIVFGVLLGRFLLGEGEARYRLAGAAVITLGGVLIAVAG